MENIIKRLVLLSTKKIVDISHIKQLLEFEDTRQPGIIITEDIDIVESLVEHEDIVQIKSMDEMEKEHLERALHHFNYNISITARNLKISRKTMHNKLKKYNIVIKKSAEII